MIRGIRGATSVIENEEQQIITATKKLIEEMVNKNNIHAETISHVLISVTDDINAGFPARALRQFNGWTFVPVMCMKEIDVPGSLKRCIRVMMVAQTDSEQQDIKHVYHNEAIKLRPDLIKESGETNE
ncbi:chorismate mutase [Virgibacillus halotolerans]|uniref:chorismate mutase n=1 Tax=Virgibacillus halotolerans TaxID=1071053 RepID=UPI001960CCF0|nr:chorismate mutase [Virgibacillus halotolerans]MBM7598362.1 chorismate mutase [Virgibacillus halotolerans]